MSALALGVLVTLAALVVGVGIGFFIGRASARPPILTDMDAIGAAEARGSASGYRSGILDASESIERECRRVLQTFPNSMGLRAAMRAIGLTVPKLSRTKKGRTVHITGDGSMTLTRTTPTDPFRDGDITLTGDGPE